jgi:hypothetical protein
MINVYLVSHNGLGDNLFMIGALRFLLNFYDKIYFLCKNKYYNDIKLFFENSNIVCVPFDENNEYQSIKSMIDVTKYQFIAKLLRQLPMEHTDVQNPQLFFNKK